MMNHQKEIHPALDEDKSRRKSWQIAFPLVVVVVLLWGANYLVTYLTRNYECSGQFGDSFGAVNALFSGLAFSGLIFAIWLQSRELHTQQKTLLTQINELAATRVLLDLQKKEMELSTKALQETAKSQQETVSLQQATAKAMERAAEAQERAVQVNIDTSLIQQAVDQLDGIAQEEQSLLREKEIMLDVRPGLQWHKVYGKSNRELPTRSAEIESRLRGFSSKREELNKFIERKTVKLLRVSSKLDIK